MINLAVARTDARLYQRVLDRNTGVNVNEKSEECALAIFRFNSKISEKLFVHFPYFHAFESKMYLSAQFILSLIYTSLLALL